MSRAARLYWRITFAVQKRATAVWADVRVVLFAAPTDLIWLNASDHSVLESGGGGGGRNWSCLCRTNGRTFATHGVWGARKAGGVNRHTPGPAGSVVNVEVEVSVVARLSVLRMATIWSDASSPTISPLVFADPCGMPSIDDR